MRKKQWQFPLNTVKFLFKLIKIILESTAEEHEKEEVAEEEKGEEEAVVPRIH